MKSLMVVITLFSVNAFASYPQCSINGTMVDLLPEVHPRADIASYVFEGAVSGGYVRIAEVDGNYFLAIKKEGQSVLVQGEKINNSYVIANTEFAIQCP
ncbi:hypothetical protein AZI85_01950 [Bdellovibrio bacteriovorus]|uniref:Uncharacterized protein n=1 Tax=Bdellovibrio bacteriovorus TaxID=959 RepID=A0A150WWA5_BDEBC|nr:hypothetical protein [Bdellovibrio bacteriovorus]KYG70719.1 hypothetical protein AZI85_01950 [Bdellovibrio bacteriovorus]